MDDFLVKPVSLASCSADRVEDYLGFAFTVLSVAVGDKSEVVSVSRVGGMLRIYGCVCLSVYSCWFLLFQLVSSLVLFVLLACSSPLLFKLGLVVRTSRMVADCQPGLSSALSGFPAALRQ